MADIDTIAMTPKLAKALTRLRDAANKHDAALDAYITHSQSAPGVGRWGKPARTPEYRAIDTANANAGRAEREAVETLIRALIGKRR